MVCSMCSCFALLLGLLCLLTWLLVGFVRLISFVGCFAVDALLGFGV